MIAPSSWRNHRLLTMNDPTLLDWKEAQLLHSLGAKIEYNWRGKDGRPEPVWFPLAAELPRTHAMERWWMYSEKYGRIYRLAEDQEG